MKLNLKILAVCSLASIVPVFAQEAPFDPLGKEAEAYLPRQVRIQVEYIEMSLKQMSSLMAESAVSKSDAALRQRITELIKSSDAKVIENQMIVARSGEKATAESIQEFIYPTEYEPSETPNQVHLHTKDGGDAQALLTKELNTGPTPTAFETRNLGSTLEVEPTIGESNTFIDVRLMPELVYHIENHVWVEWKDKHGIANIMMPTFYTLRLNTAVTVANGKHALLGALSPKDDQGVTDTSRKIFVFVKADIVFAGR